MTAQNDELTAPSAGSRFDTGVREAMPMPIDDDVAEAAPRLGPDSLIWKFYGDNRTQLFGFQRTAGVENCIEQLAQGVLDHSVIFSDTLGRAKRTAPPLMNTVYSDEPHEWGRKVRDFHKTIKGTISDGSRYHALNPELFYWAHASFVDQVIYNTDTFIRRLSHAEKEQIFNEGKLWYSLYGVSDRGQPQIGKGVDVGQRVEVQCAGGPQPERRPGVVAEVPGDRRTQIGLGILDRCRARDVQQREVDFGHVLDPVPSWTATPRTPGLHSRHRVALSPYFTRSFIGVHVVFSVMPVRGSSRRRPNCRAGR
ncbi:oxygenase MpaB family protein [Mycobacterium colombiense]|uniref:oxygenase MpaB family protein n=1 Tax=Mycobacterium colombiense TaxID=339268 RepID=UPI000A63255D|nr:oxygenase MpaB family protein [Mycobacterium colombiense]